jgi:hypothetical protein
MTEEEEASSHSTRSTQNTQRLTDACARLAVTDPDVRREERKKSKVDFFMSRQHRISVPLPAQAPARRLSTAPTPPSASSQLQETPDPDVDNDNVSQPSAE